MSIVLITGAGTGIGNLTAKALARAGHMVYASMRDIDAERAQALRQLAADECIDLRTVKLDVQSEESARDAVATVVTEAGGIDVVVHNAGHLAVGYAEAFTADDIAHLFDVNVLGAQRVNRAVLPHLRERRQGTLLYVGSTSVIDVPPFLGPYVASKAAFDVMAQATRYEVSQFGIETVIVMPGPFTRGTEHFPNASRASDTETAAGYAELDPLVARNLEATRSLFEPGVDPDPVAVADEITRILALPYGKRPFRSVVDFTRFDVDEINDLTERHIREAMIHMDLGHLLTVNQD
ncbi:SDR family oxidoreductase [Streptomyces longwoodensis]|uniref:SDR family oxidoreductase n=1 Tax=Streptomyces longwoodensis TaxID=68231 RepID=UPI0033C5F063